MIDELKQFQPSSGVNRLMALTSSELDSRVRAYWPGLRKLSETIPLPSVAAQMKRIEFKLKMLHTNEEIIGLMAALGDRLDDDLNAQWFLHVPDHLAQLYRSSDPFGDEVAKAFKPSRDDIEAAGKALALGLGTAAVFHLMRAMEAAVGRLCAELEINNVEREWGKLLSDIGDKIKGMPKATEYEKKKKNQWSECHANLFHVKQAWRNDTMHPRQSYQPDEAKEVFEATRVFMKHLSTLVSEVSADSETPA